MKQFAKKITLMFIFLYLATSIFAEEINLPSNKKLIITAPLGWDKKTFQSGDTRVAWRKPTPKDTGFLLIKTSEGGETDTEGYMRIVTHTYLMQKTEILSEPEKIMINGIEWYKINSKNEMEEGFSLKTETYCFVQDNVAIQIRIMAPSEYWTEVKEEVKNSLGSIIIK